MGSVSKGGGLIRTLKFLRLALKAYRDAERTGDPQYVALKRFDVPVMAVYVATGRQAWRISTIAVEAWEPTKGGGMKYSVLFSEKTIRERIIQLGVQISEDYKNKDLVVIGVREGAMPFFWQLLPQLTCGLTATTITAKSYEGTKSTGRVRVEGLKYKNVANRDVLIVEDIIDTGRTLCNIYNEVWGMMPASVKVCTLLDKTAAREEGYKSLDFLIRYVGFPITKKFVVGFGMDYNDQYREMPDIHDWSEV